MLAEKAYYIVSVDINSYAYCNMGIFNNGQYLDTTYPEVVESAQRKAYLPLVRSSPLPDMLSATPYICFSERTYRLFTENLKIWPGIHWVKVKAMNRRDRHVADYWWPKYLRRDEIRALDLTHAEYTTYPPEGVIPRGKLVVKDVIRWVVNPAVIGDWDFFAVYCREWFGTPRLRDLVLQHKLTGFEWHPVSAWLPD